VALVRHSSGGTKKNYKKVRRVGVPSKFWTATVWASLLAILLERSALQLWFFSPKLPFSVTDGANIWKLCREHLKYVFNLHLPGFIHENGGQRNNYHGHGRRWRYTWSQRHSSQLHLQWKWQVASVVYMSYICSPVIYYCEIKCYIRYVCVINIVYAF
jgi:hypothetical protein